MRWNMIKCVEFKNFRNVSGVYKFDKTLNIIIGKNSTGKTNILDGIKVAFSTITDDYCKISLSDFKGSNPNNDIEINIELKYNAISSFNHKDMNGNDFCGFKVKIIRTHTGRIIKKVSLFYGGRIDMDIVREDPNIPSIYSIPLLRIEDIYSSGLTAGITNFIDSEEKYKNLRQASKEAIKKELKEKETRFLKLCDKFNQSLKIELSDPKISDEKIYIVDGDEEHNFRIGAGYKSVANIMLNTLNENYKIILIDEIENHLHPALIRNLIRELRGIANTIIIASTHSSVVINELELEELIDVSGKKLTSISQSNQQKLKRFLHPGRNELILADKVILVEGYTEEMLLRYYLSNNNNNWTIINVAGVMFEPYIELCVLLNKECLVISDTDCSQTDGNSPTTRFENLKLYCGKNGIKLFAVNNTLETDLYNNGFIKNDWNLLEQHDEYDVMVAKSNKKTEIAGKIIEEGIDLSKMAYPKKGE
jgi:predicted ATP-dependent endonuclease of OLD family